MKIIKNKFISLLLCAAVIISAVCYATLPTKAASEEFTKPSNEFLSGINCGWNLGNSLDSWPGGDETSWGNPVITKAQIDAVRARGFNAIRIPVTYYETIGAAPDYTISAAHLKRVKEVVDYAVANDMYIVLNSHHEKGWLSCVVTDSKGNIKQPEYDNLLAKFKAMWTQIATVFRDYGEKLILEGMNEMGKGSYTATDEVAWKGIDTLNQTFFDAVRATGGNNAKRYLVMVGYGASCGWDMIESLTIPNDPANHIILDFHTYSPSGFCFPPSVSSTSDDTTFSTKQLKLSIGTAVDNCSRMLDMGIPVIIGEMGAVDKDNDPERARYAKEFISIIGEYGVKAFWWDNNSFGHTKDSESFGLINRSTLEWVHGTVADAMIAEANKYVGVVYPAPVATTAAPTTIAPTTIAPTTIAPTTAPTTVPTTLAVLFGDVNSDKAINAKDVLVLKQYFADWVVTIDSAAADVNADNAVNAKDLLKLRQYLADWKVHLGQKD